MLVLLPMSMRNWTCRSSFLRYCLKSLNFPLHANKCSVWSGLFRDIKLHSWDDVVMSTRFNGWVPYDWYVNLRVNLDVLLRDTLSKWFSLPQLRQVWFWAGHFRKGDSCATTDNKSWNILATWHSLGILKHFESFRQSMVWWSIVQINNIRYRREKVKLLLGKRFFIIIITNQIYIHGKTLQKLLYTNKIKFMLSMCALFIIKRWKRCRHSTKPKMYKNDCKWEKVALNTI